MKNDKIARIILATIFALFLGFACSAQNMPLDSVSIAKKSILTKDFHTDKQGNKRHIFQGSKGGLFVIRKSAKTGNWYKYYLPKTAK